MAGGGRTPGPTWVVRKLLGQWERLYLRDGVVCRSIRDPVLGETVCQVVVPEGQIQALLQAYHTPVRTSRAREDGVLLRRHFPLAREGDICALVHPGNVRAAHSSRRERRCEPTGPHTSQGPFAHRGHGLLDVGSTDGSFPEYSSGNRPVHKYAWAFRPWTRPPPVNPTQMLCGRQYSSSLGVQRLLSIKGQTFESKVVQELCQLYGCKKTHTTPYHPQEMGGVRRLTRLAGPIGDAGHDRQIHWVESLPALVQAYNNSVHSTTGMLRRT